MAVDDHIRVVRREQLSRRGTAQLIPVTDMYEESADLDANCGREARIAGGIGVAMDRPHGSDDRQLVQNVITADIARMQNELNSGKRIMHTRPHQPMGIRYQSNDVAVRSAGHGLYISR
jgi:hypothetical protein